MTSTRRLGDFVLRFPDTCLQLLRVWRFGDLYQRLVPTTLAVSGLTDRRSGPRRERQVPSIWWIGSSTPRRRTGSGSPTSRTSRPGPGSGTVAAERLHVRRCAREGNNLPVELYGRIESCSYRDRQFLMATGHGGLVCSHGDLSGNPGIVEAREQCGHIVGGCTKSRGSSTTRGRSPSRQGLVRRGSDEAAFKAPVVGSHKPCQGQ